ECRDGVDRHAQVKGLQSAPAGITLGERALHALEDAQVIADRLVHHKLAGVFERLADLLAARNFADPGATVAVGQDHQVAGEERPMRTAEVQQHAVAAGDRNDLKTSDHGCGHVSSPGVGLRFPFSSSFAWARHHVPKASDWYR